MPQYIALLRAVNLGKRNKVKMAVLRKLVAGLGCREVRTYIASGNLLAVSDEPAEVFGASIKGLIADHFGLDIAVLVRTPEQLRGLQVANPFPEAEPRMLHVAFLSEAPEDPSPLQAIEATAVAGERLVLRGRELFLHFPQGLGRSKLSGTLLERKLRVTATMRSWRTVTRLQEMVS